MSHLSVKSLVKPSVSSKSKGDCSFIVILTVKCCDSVFFPLLFHDLTFVMLTCNSLSLCCFTHGNFSSSFITLHIPSLLWCIWNWIIWRNLYFPPILMSFCDWNFKLLFRHQAPNAEGEPSVYHYNWLGAFISNSKNCDGQIFYFVYIFS